MVNTTDPNKWQNHVTYIRLIFQTAIKRRYSIYNITDLSLKDDNSPEVPLFF